MILHVLNVNHAIYIHCYIYLLLLPVNLWVLINIYYGKFQVQVRDPKFSGGVLSCLIKIKRDEGFRGFFKVSGLPVMAVGHFYLYFTWCWSYFISVVVQSTLSKVDTLGTKATVRFREVSALERVHVTWYLNLQCTWSHDGPVASQHR